MKTLFIIQTRVKFLPLKIFKPESSLWDVAEDVALMSSWCIVSEDKICGKNQKFTIIWAKVKKLYDEAQAESPEKIGKRNIQQMKGRYKRLCQSVHKWVRVCEEARRRAKSGMSQKDIESEAHKIYQQDVKSKFTDIVVYNDVMCKNQKWAPPTHHDTTRYRPECEEENEESGGSTKRSRTSEEGDYSNPETPNTG
ncbi:glutathione S-transferase T3-like [Bidens hawaiensis]|uniref:glutathione S-transferase T3-like n=1 Tax=Bidens hawaiensis TaxID=980011 RepID=UPI00404A2A14